MANPAPTAPIHHGAQGGSDRASNTPVNSAEPSMTPDRIGRPANHKQPASQAKPTRTVIARRLNAGQPNSNKPYKVAGRIASNTAPINRGTLSWSWA